MIEMTGPGQQIVVTGENLLEREREREREREVLSAHIRI